MCFTRVREHVLRYLVLTALMLLPNVTMLFKSRDIGFALGVLIQALALWLWFSIIVSNIRHLAILSIPWILVLPVETYFIYTYGYPSSRHVIALLAETSPQEIQEYLSGLWGILAVSLLTLAGILAYLLHDLKSTRLVAKSIQISALIWFVIFICGFEILREKPWAPLLIRQYTLANSFPFGIIYRVAGFAKYYVQSLQTRKTILQYHFGATTGFLSEITLILVIGESARPDHWGLNGYIKNTTPRLGARSDVYFMGNLATPWALTLYSAPLLITRKPASYNGVFPERSLFSAFKEAGFTTFWFTNQNEDNEIALHSEEADQRKLFNFSVGRGDVDAAFDAIILPDIDTALATPALKRFVVIHTKGSHWEYHLRYPPEFKIFQPDQTINGIDKYDKTYRDSLVNAYDNSIRYTDYFLNELIEKLERTGKPAAVMYVSDHGEALYDKDCDIFGHGNDTDINFRTAGFVWVSPELTARRSGLITALQRNSKEPLSTDLTVFNTLVDLGELNITDRTYSLLNAELQVRPRLVNTSSGVVDFDRSSRWGVCSLVTVPTVGVSDETRR